MRLRSVGGWRWLISDYALGPVTFPTEAQRGARVGFAALLIGCFALLCACGGSAASLVVPRARSAAKLPLHVFETVPQGMRIASLPRATPGVLWLALYIDAGSRDSTLPETATLSARLAAERVGPDAVATVFPDVTEISLSCNPDTLARCVERLTQALATRTADEAALASARTKLRDDQRRTLASEPDSALDALAVQALLGEKSRNFFPLGSVDSDLVAAGQDVTQYLSDHYGPERALLVAAGDIAPNALKGPATDAVQSLPRANKPRGQRELAPVERAKLAISFDAKSGAALALAGHDESALRDATQSLAALLAHSETTTSVKGHVFAARSGALALLHLRGSDAEQSLREATRALARMQREPPASSPPDVQPDDLRSGARELGFKFGAEGGVGPRALFFSAALALPAEPDGGPADMPRQAEREQQRRKRAQSQFDEVLAQADPKLSGDLDDYVAAVQLKNGARVDVQFLQGNSVAVAIRIANGAAADPPSLHGRAALLSTLSNMYCAGMGPELLHSRFSQLGATLDPRVDAESYGALLRVPKENFQPATELLLRCLRTPSKNPIHLTEASVRLQQQLKHGPESLRARTADYVSPKAPGPFAPAGDPTRIPNLQLRELEQTLRENQVGDRWAIGVVGPVEVQTSTAWLARRLADLPGTPRTAAPHWDEPSSQPSSEPPRSRGLQGSFIAVWTARGEYPGTVGAELFARALRALVGALPGVEVQWHEAAQYKQTSYAALALKVRQDLLPSATTWLQDAAKSLDNVWLEQALEPAIAEADRLRNAAQAELGVRAEQIARLRLGASFEVPTLDSARKQIVGLRAAQPGIVLLP
jgi:predicted Zn-dependent peptidase